MQASPLDVPKANWRQDEELEIFSDAVGQFFEKECVPHVPQWRKDGIVPMEIWKKAGEMGLLGASVPEEYGGAGGDFRHEAIIIEQQQWKGVDGFGITLHNAIIAPYIVAYGTEGGQFQEAGFSTVVCGPGSIAQAHQPDEFVAVSELKACDAFLEKLRVRLEG